jgi:protein-S-isoprenylcysteine O-methyltransferase Ste14
MKKINSLAAKYRTAVTRVVAILLVLIILVSTHSFPDGGFWDVFLEVTGVFLLGLGCLGRLWALMYISGNKIHTVVTEGPYSIVRHPLYVFSLLGAVGIGLLTENVAVLAILFVFFIIYYPFVIAAEEHILLTKHDREYEEYMAAVPRFIPRWSLLKEPLTFSVHTAIYRRTFFEAIWFIWAFIPLEIIERLHEAGILPVFFRIP